MLQPFIRYLQRYYVASYVWKTESQFNGNIHFHITIDTFIPWRHICSKWNKICARHGYCEEIKTDNELKADAATQIKAICNENDLAKTIGGYLTRGSIEEKNHYRLKKNSKDKSTYKDFLTGSRLPRTTTEAIISESNPNWNHITAPHCVIESKKENLRHYSRFIEGRLWGCSENLSNINIFTSEAEDERQCNDVEREFFKENNLQNLGSILKAEAKAKAGKLDQSAKHLLRLDDESINKKFSPLDYVFIHRHLKFCKLPTELAQKIAGEKQKGKFATQKQFTVESLL